MKVFVFGGTTEGKAVSNWLSDLKIEHFYSTKTTSGNYESEFGTRICGAMSEAECIEFCQSHQVDLMIDAAHPFADQLHQTAVAAARNLKVPIARLERDFVERVSNEYIIYCHSLADVFMQIKDRELHRILSLTGVKSLPFIHSHLGNCEVWYRILDFPSSLQIAQEAGVDQEHLLVASAFEQMSSVKGMLLEQKIEAILTKESGYSGMLDQKIEMAIEQQIPLFVIMRPELPEYDAEFTNREGLQKYLKQEFNFERKELAHGFTSGTCATIASKAALKLLLGEEVQQKERIVLPDGGNCEMVLHQQIKGEDYAICSVVKNSGDDPDITDGMEIGAKLMWNQTEEFRFVKGEGVGTVTVEGLGIPVGEPAVNPVPRKMIAFELQQLLEESEINKGIDISIFVPKGRQLGAKTFNPKLGIEGGISIIGTTGRIKPYSLEAFVETMRRQVDVAIRNQQQHIVINSGGRSERYLKNQFPEVSNLAFLQYGNFIGEMLQVLQQAKVKKVSMGIMTGKAIKLAAGHMDTHSKKVVFDHQFLLDLTHSLDYPEEILQKISTIKMGRELESIFQFSNQEAFFRELKRRCEQHCKKILKETDFEILLISNKGKVI